MPLFDYSEISDNSIIALNILSLMLYPDPENHNEARIRWLLRALFALMAQQQYEALDSSCETRVEVTKQFGEWFGSTLADMELDWSILAKLLCYSGKLDSLPNETERTISKAQRSGAILKIALAIPCGLHDACLCLQAQLTPDRPAPLEHEKIGKHLHQESWRPYKSVAHLWAAYLDNKGQGDGTCHPLGLLQRLALTQKGLSAFLSLSDQYLQDGCQHYPKRGVPKALLDRSEAIVFTI